MFTKEQIGNVSATASDNLSSDLVNDICTID